MPIVIMSSPVRRSRLRSTSWSVRRRPGWRRSGLRRSPMGMVGAAMEGGTVTEDEEASSRYIVVKALEDGVVIMGLTRQGHPVPPLGAPGRRRGAGRAVHGADRGDQDPRQGRDPDRRGEGGVRALGSQG